MPDGFFLESAGVPGEAARPNAAPAQQGSHGGADASPEVLGEQANNACGETVSRAEFDKVVAQRQAAKEKVRQLAAEAEQMLERLRQMPGEDERRAFQDWKRRQQEAGVSPDQQTQDIEAIERRLQQPLASQIEALRGRKDALERRLTDLLRNQELRVAAARANAINPEQVVALLRNGVQVVEVEEGRFVPRFSDSDGRPILDGDKPLADTTKFVERFLSMPENANLVRSTVTPGSGARQAGGMTTHMDPTPRSRAEFLALAPEQRLAVANRMTRQQRDAILGRGSADGGAYL